MPETDFNSMQNQAIKYAREMQKRANLENNSNSAPSSTGFGNQKSGSPFGQYRSITGQTPFCGSACPVKNILGIGSSGQGSADNDMLTLMAILLLLASDGGDRMLMLALLYIMT